MNKPHCLACNDTGILHDTVYYPFCSLLGRRYCQCPAGEQAFREWYLSAKVQDALKSKRKKEVENAIAFSHLPKRWMEKSLENLHGQEKLKVMIVQYLDNFTKLGL